MNHPTMDLWAFVIAAYSVAGVGLTGLAIIVFVRLHAWAKRARELEQK